MADPNFASVVLLLHCDGANGATTITDSSTAAHSVTGSGGSTLTTAQQKFGTASLQTGSGAANAADSDDWWFGSGQFTVEAWIRPTGSMVSAFAIAAQFGGSGNLGWFFGFNGNNLFFYYSTTGSDNPAVGAAYTPTANAWVHVAADRDASNVLRVYANGAVVASGTAAATFFNSTRTLAIGNDENLNRGFPGQIDEVRITKGIARYAGAFTPPTAPFEEGASAAAQQYAVSVIVA